MNINLNLYKYFYEIAKHNSFTKAANDLLISQPSLSYSMKVLEDQLGYRLFIRENNKIKLTTKGEQLYQKIEAVFNIIDTINDDDEIKGNVSVGIRPLLAMYALPAYVNQLVRLYPNINIKYKMCSDIELINGLKNDEFDFIIDEYDYKNKDIDSIECTGEDNQNGFVMATKYFDDIVVDEKYLQENKILISSINRYSKDFLEMYNIVDFIETMSTPILVEELLHQKKVGFSNLFVIRKEIKDEKLKVLKTTLKLPKSFVYISYNKNKTNKRINAIIDFFKNYKFEEIELLNAQNEDK